MRLHCLHGFLGSPGDWDGLVMALGRSLPTLKTSGAIIRADLFGADSFPETTSISAWAEAYCLREMRTVPAGAQTAGRYLLGYSLGGRLALHMAVQDPALWDGVIIVGANPGLDSEAAREQRRAHDETWARRFESESWGTVLAAWDAQPVFADMPSALGARLERDFSRARLADALRRWSLGAQFPVWEALRTLPCPVFWVAGAEDAGQAAICRRVRETIPHADIWIVPDAGHRVPWEQPHAFADRVAEFLGTTQQRLESGGQ